MEPLGMLSALLTATIVRARTRLAAQSHPAVPIRESAAR
jgi:hypothetical protein